MDEGNTWAHRICRVVSEIDRGSRLGVLGFIPMTHPAPGTQDRSAVDHEAVA